jgi:hypothetical protein
MFPEVRISKELVNWHAQQNEQIKVKSPTCKTDMWGTPANSKAKVRSEVKRRPARPSGYPPIGCKGWQSKQRQNLPGNCCGQ